MKKSKQKTKIILVAAVVLDLLLVGVYAYAFNTVKVKNENASLVSEELDEYLSKEGTINILKKTVKDTEEERGKLNSYFVERDDLPDFAKKIESLRELAEVSLEITGLGENQDVLSLDITSSGSFSRILNLISFIETLPFKVEITKAYINTIDILDENDEVIGTEWDGNISINLTGFIGK